MQMLDIYRKYRKKSDIFDIFENITIFSNPAHSVADTYTNTSFLTNMIIHIL